MHVNPPDQAPRTASDQATRILTNLGLPTDDMNVRKRVETFIICNGYAGVQRAAQLTQRQMQRNPQLVADPWPYTVRVYNANAARLSYLYVLTHWAESGLRSQLHHYQLRALGETWHRFPTNYLNGRQIHDFIQQTRWLITWDKPPGMPEQVARPATPTEFLEQISLAWLAKMVLFAHRKNARLILVHPIDGNIDYQRAESILKASEDARNAVAHHKYITNEAYAKGEAALLKLLHLLQFDVAKALRGVEIERRLLVQQAITKLERLPS